MPRLSHRFAAGAALYAIAAVAGAQQLPNPVMFVKQFPVPGDFASIGSVFANHEADPSTVGRGGDLYIRYPDGTLRNLTQEAGFGVASGFQGATSIAVRDPAVHWNGTKAVFAMTIGAPAQQFQQTDHRWQLYEVTGLGQGQTAAITKLPNQPVAYNNVQPAYASDGDVIFVSDRPRDGSPHLYPQHDEYESTATPTGLWRLDAATGVLTLLQHSPSGSFTPIVDSFGRVLFTRWDHLQRDQQNDDVETYGTFNFSGEAAGTVPTAARDEVFPEPRLAVAGSGIAGHRINHFFPWQLNQDGTEEETLNHIGRHELHGFFEASFPGDPNLEDFNPGARTNPNSILNMLQIREDPTLPGRYVAIDAPEFDTHASGQLIRIVAPPSLNPALATIEYLTPRSTFGTNPNAAGHTGHYRNPLPLSNGVLLAAHTDHKGGAANTGTRANPATPYAFRLKRLAASGGFFAPAENLTAGITKSVSYFDPDVLVSYDGPFWELSPVEVVARTPPPDSAFALRAPESAAFVQEQVDPVAFREYLRRQNLAVVVMRDVTSRDVADEQQPYNLRVPNGKQTLGDPGTVYDIAHMQFFQGDQIRGIGGTASPRPGRRVLAQVMHDKGALAANKRNPGGPPGSVPIFSDGSVALYVPTRRALAWQATAPNGTPVVRERYWITFQPGEIRACDGCHGVNQANQAGGAAAQNTALAFRDLLAQFRTDAPLFSDEFE